MNNNPIDEVFSDCLSIYSIHKMLSFWSIVRLYDNVLSSDVHYYNISEEDIRSAIRNMSEVYKPNKANWMQEVSKVADYNDPAHRCAYLHKYAALHTSLVQDMFSRALSESSILRHALLSNLECLKICSLGGGPGTDVIGILAAVNQNLGLLPCSVKVVELMSEWENTFNSIVEELHYGYYGIGTLSQNLDPEYFDSSYVTTDLLGTMNSVVNKAIGSANLITMVKFVSATTCKDTAVMVEKVFNSMKPGALVLFIDNAAGGFSELITRLAEECKLSPVFGPLNHEYYGNHIFSLDRYGYTSCSGTTVTVHLLMKSYKKPSELKLQTSLTYYNKNVNAPLVQHSSSNVTNFVYPSPTQSSERKEITVDRVTAAVKDESMSRNVPAVTKTAAVKDKSMSRNVPAVTKTVAIKDKSMSRNIPAVTKTVAVKDSSISRNVPAVTKTFDMKYKSMSRNVLAVTKTVAVKDKFMSRNVPAITNQPFFPKSLDFSSNGAQQERDMYSSQLPDLKISFGNTSDHTNTKQLLASVSQYSTTYYSDSQSSKIKAEMATVQIPPRRNINTDKWEVFGNKTNTYGTFSTGSSLSQLETKPLNSRELISGQENVLISHPNLDFEQDNRREVCHSARTQEYNDESNLFASTSSKWKQPVNEINGKSVKNIKNSVIVTSESRKNVNSLATLPLPVYNERHFQGTITTQPSTSDFSQRKEPVSEDEHTLDDQTCCNYCLNSNVFTNIWCCVKNRLSQ